MGGVVMKKTSKKLMLILLIMILTTTLLSGCSSTEESEDASSSGSTGENGIVIGSVQPMTGPNAKIGKEITDAIEVAIDIINNPHDELGDFPFAKTEGIPNMNGAKLRLVTADHQSNPEIGATETERLITEEDVDIILGSYESVVTKTASVAAERLEVPFLTSTSTSDELSERDFKWYFRTGPKDIDFVDNTVEFLDAYKSEIGIETVATVAEDTDFGMQFSEVFNEKATAAGYEIVENISYPSSSPNVSAELLRIQKANPDVIVQTGYVSDAIMFMNGYKDMNINPKMIIGQRGGFTSPEFFTTLGDTAEYVMTTSAFTVDITEGKPHLEKINELYKEKSGVDLNSEYSRVMQTVFVIADALNRAKGTDNESIRQALLETDIGPEWLIVPYDGVRFNDDQQNSLATGIVTQYLDGQYRTIYPKKHASREAVIPVPAWEDR